MLTGEPDDIPGRGVDASLPKSFVCTRPGSGVICHHGKSNPTISPKLCFPVWILCKNQNDFSNPRPPTTATRPCRMLSRLLDRWELPASARHSCRALALSAAGSWQTSVRFWPLRRPTSYSAWAPRTSAAIPTALCKQMCDILLHCEPDCRGTCSSLLAEMLKAHSQISASRPSAARRHSWTEKDNKQSWLISSNHSSQEMTHQVKAGAQAQFGKVSVVCSGSTLPTPLFLSSLQILAVSHPSEAVNSGWRQTLAPTLVLQHSAICKPSIPTFQVWVATAVVIFFPSQTGAS